MSLVGDGRIDSEAAESVLKDSDNRRPPMFDTWPGMLDFQRSRRTRGRSGRGIGQGLLQAGGPSRNHEHLG